jgi:thiamine monophosphate synthase
MPVAKHSIDYSLYLVIQTDALRGASFVEVLEAALLGGVSIVQLREKTASTLDFLNLARTAKGICDRVNGL